MNAMKVFLLVSGLATSAIACGGGGECAKAFDKEIECSDRSDERKAEMKKFRDEAISVCEKDKSAPGVKRSLACAAKDSCEEYRSCVAGARADEQAEKIDKQVANGEELKALTSCTYNFEEYEASEKMKAACEKVFTKALKEAKTDKQIQEVDYTCSSGSDVDKWLKASPAFKEGCETLMATIGKKITGIRDKGGEYDYGMCSGYKKLGAKLAEDKGKGAELLCEEADLAEKGVKAVAEAKKNVEGKKTSVPYECKSFFEKGEKKLKDSAWFKTRSKEVATACFSELGVLVLSKAERYCMSNGKLVHKYAAQYGLAEGNEALKAALEKTSESCNK